MVLMILFGCIIVLILLLISLYNSAHAPKLANASFHFSARREEEAKEETSSEVADKGGFMGTGLSHLYAIPAGVAFGVPILEFNWFLVNEETLVSTTRLLLHCWLVFGLVIGLVNFIQSRYLYFHGSSLYIWTHLTHTTLFAFHFHILLI